MTEIDVHQSIGPDLQALLNSNLFPQILLVLLEHPHTVAALRARISGTYRSFSSVLQKMGEEGLVERGLGEYVLSNSGLFLSSKLVKLLENIIAMQHNSVERMSPKNNVPTDWLFFYHHHRKFLRWIFNSSLVLRIMISLHSGPKTRRELRDDTGSLSQNIRTRLRQMEEWGLVSEKGYTYALTTEGYGIVTAIKDLLQTYVVTSKYGEFWNRYSLKWIPPQSFDKIHEMGRVTINYDGSGYENYVNYQTFLHILTTGGHVHGISPWVTPEMVDGVTKQAKKGTPVSLVLSPDLASYIYREYYSGSLDYLKIYPHVRVSVFPGPITFGMTVTDSCLVLKIPLKDDRTYDSARIMGCGSPEACRWAERVFEHYLEHSIPIEDFVAGEDMAQRQDESLALPPGQRQP